MKLQRHEIPPVPSPRSETERRLLVAALTYRRPAGLVALLDGLAALRLPSGRVEFLIVDNSPDATARFLVTARAERFPAPLTYLHEPRRGLTPARNRALEHGLDNADLMAFIDDDETPDPGWLIAHLDTLDRTGCAASHGAVHAAFETPPAPWLARGGFLEFRGLPRHAALPTGSTANILFDLAPIRRLGLRFDPDFSLTGGEDTEFFDRLIRDGGAIRFTPEAVVTETIVPARATLAWLRRRWRRTGATDAMIRLKRRPGTRTRLACLAGGLARLAAGTILAATLAPAALSGRAERPLRGLRIAARGLGFLDVLGGSGIEEYRTPTR